MGHYRAEMVDDGPAIASAEDRRRKLYLAIHGVLTSTSFSPNGSDSSAVDRMIAVRLQEAFDLAAAQVIGDNAQRRLRETGEVK